MIPTSGYTLIKSGSAPRVCGDDPDMNQIAKVSEVCSPRMRG